MSWQKFKSVLKKILHAGLSPQSVASPEVNARQVLTSGDCGENFSGQTVLSIWEDFPSQYLPEIKLK